MLFSSRTIRTATGATLSRGKIVDIPTCLIQLELQRDGDVWNAKGCTAYVSDGSRRPIPFVARTCSSRTEAILAMKCRARHDMASQYNAVYLHINWQVVIWTPAWFVGPHRHSPPDRP